MIKVTEYLAGGRPVVAFDLTETRRTAGMRRSMRRAVISTAFAWLIVRLAESGRPSPESWRSGPRARAEELVWERSEEELLGAYERL